MKHAGTLKGLAVFFGCQRCSAVYQADQHYLDSRGMGSFSCRNCGAIVHSWSGPYSFTNWRVFDPTTGRVAGRVSK